MSMEKKANQVTRSCDIIKNMEKEIFQEYTVLRRRKPYKKLCPT